MYKKETWSYNQRSVWEIEHIGYMEILGNKQLSGQASYTLFSVAVIFWLFFLTS